MEDTRRHLDDDIADLRRILARHESGSATARPIVDRGATTSDHAAVTTQKGATREAILRIMADGQLRRTGEVAKQLGKTKGSIATAMIRMVSAGLLENPAYGLYVIAGPKAPTDPEGASGVSAPDANRLPLHEGRHGEESS